eukprot:1141960-Pelagomonas_calceolata.AAC.3
MQGLLSMANRGPDTNGNHFSILMSPAPHLNTHYTVFGEVVSNLERGRQHCQKNRTSRPWPGLYPAESMTACNVIYKLQALIKINELARGKPNNEWTNTQDAQITDVGQIRQGVPVPKEVILDGLRD